MPGKHADGYRAAYRSAEREAAQRWKRDHPDEWRRLLDGRLTLRGLKAESS